MHSNAFEKTESRNEQLFFYKSCLTTMPSVQHSIYFYMYAQRDTEPFFQTAHVVPKQ